MGFLNSLFGGNSNKYYGKAIDYGKGMQQADTNLANPWITGGQGDFNAYNDMLSGPGQDAAFQKWLNSSDYAFTTKAGNDAINSNMAAKGLLNSGATLKAITQFGQNNAQQYRNNYMNQLLGGANIGAGTTGQLMGANTDFAKLIADAYAGKSTAQANGVGNFLNFGLGVAGLIPGVSDRRLKTDIKKIGKTDKDGLPVYTYRFKDDPANVTRMGVMAQDVAKKRPDAMGPKLGNFMTVDYGRLANA